MVETLNSRSDINIAEFASQRPFVVGFGGTTRPDSSSERALRISMQAAEAAGAATLLVPAAELEFPMYRPGAPGSEASDRFVEALRYADGVLIASPGYHGGMSGLIKNALDYVEDLRDDERPYFDGRAIGCICCAHGWQATTTTLVSLRSVVHALRGWPTPIGVAINSAEPHRDPSAQLELLGQQVVKFALMRMASR
jgi:FMN reductase